MSYLTINIDMDGVVYNFTDAFALLNPDLTLDRSQWNLGLESEVFSSRFEEAIVAGVFLIGEPIEGAIEGLEGLIRAGHRVRLVTAKQMKTSYLTYVAQANTLQWLDRRMLLDRVEVVFTDHAKIGYAADVVIDDHPGLAWTQRFADNLLFDQPWNRTTDRAAHPVHVMVGWESVIEWIEGEQAA